MRRVWRNSEGADSYDDPAFRLEVPREQQRVGLARAVTRRLEAAALARPRIVELLAGATPKKVIVVPDRLVNIVP